MHNKTILLAATTIVILGAVVGIGIMTSQRAKPAPTPKATTAKKEAPLPSQAELNAQLEKELPAITKAFYEAFPAASGTYTIDHGKLYHRGEWYGTTLTYAGSDSNNRDTLRVIMQKKNGVWAAVTNPPQIMLSSVEYPDAPKSMLDDINKPAPLPGTATSPAIN